MLRQLFHPCTPDFIATVCHARCCESSTSETGVMITIHATEKSKIESLGGRVNDAGFLSANPLTKKCPFKTGADLCGLHGKPEKPFGCIASPFTLNARDSLIVRNRYRCLKCYRAPGAIPAYKAHRASLDKIFGAATAEKICAHLDAGGGDTLAEMPAENYAILKANDLAKKTVHAGLFA